MNKSGSSLGGTISTYEQSASRIASFQIGIGQFKQEQHEAFEVSLNSTSIVSGSVIFINAAIEQRLDVIIPNYKPVMEMPEPQQLGSREQTFNDLKRILSTFDSKYLFMLEGSESALKNRSDPDYLSQAAHSMRDLFQQLIEELAPSNAVKTKSWFDPVDGAPGGVSRRLRLKYILCGSSENPDEEEMEQLDEAANRAKDALDLAMARAHDHDPELTEGEVRLSIDHARFSLLELLKRFVTRYK